MFHRDTAIDRRDADTTNQGFPVSSTFHTLSRHENQALGLGQFAIDFLAGRFGQIDAAVYVTRE